MGHQRANHGSGLNGVMPRINLHADSASEHVFDGACHLAANRINDFRLDCGTMRQNGLHERGIFFLVLFYGALISAAHADSNRGKLASLTNSSSGYTERRADREG